MKKDRAATEEKIYNAFLAILKEKGPQGVGINAIAKEAGVSKELIYRYFGGLKGLLLQYAQKGDFFKSLLVLNEKDTSLNHALQLMIGGYVYFILLSKFHKKFINTDLSSEETWSNFDEALEKTIELFNNKQA